MKFEKNGYSFESTVFLKRVFNSSLTLSAVVLGLNLNSTLTANEKNPPTTPPNEQTSQFSHFAPDERFPLAKKSHSGQNSRHLGTGARHFIQSQEATKISDPKNPSTFRRGVGSFTRSGTIPPRLSGKTP